MNKCVFLDRDGILNTSVIVNNKPFAPKSVSDLIITPNIKSKLTKLKSNGILLIVITNQPDVSRGTATRESVDQINKALQDYLPLDEIYVCFHDNSDNCKCRKPKPGNIINASKKYNIDLDKSFMIGDRRGDVQAGNSVGLTTIFVDYNYSEEKPLDSNYIVETVPDALDIAINYYSQK